MLQGIIGNGLYAQTSGDYDFYSLKAGSGQKIVINLSPTIGSKLDGVIALYDSAGNSLLPPLFPGGPDVHDSNAPGVPEYVSYITTKADTYYVAVYASNFSGDAPLTNPFVPESVWEVCPPIRGRIGLPSQFSLQDLGQSNSSIFLFNKVRRCC